MRTAQQFAQGSVRPGANPLGAQRVLSPKGVLPQAALRLDPGLPLYADETLLTVSRLNLDSASFRQLRESCGADAKAVAARIFEIVRERGKMQNPVTGSGGMLLGEVTELGPQAPPRFARGDRIATLVSLTLTPLRLESILQVDLDRGQLEVRGGAILFASAPAAKLPKDLPDALVLAVLDVCGAPAWVRRLVRAGDKVLILGAGKSGVLAAAAAIEAIPSKDLWFSDVSEDALELAMGLGVGQNAFRADAQDPLDFAERHRRSGAPCFDLVVNACNAAETETSAILAAKPGARVLFFNMATSFSRAVLSAEGLGRDVQLIMGNGYAEGHAEYALDLLRRDAGLRRLFNA